MKTYNQEEVNDLIKEKEKTNLFERIVDFGDNMYNMGFGEGYKQGFEEAKVKNNEKSN